MFKLCTSCKKEKELREFKTFCRLFCLDCIIGELAEERIQSYNRLRSKYELNIKRLKDTNWRNKLQWGFGQTNDR